ncbi:very-long-chain (3R)-3-hydroxyacyl-CoA dehydratase 2-like [Sycon ciliatum]|uniref:very-long-chain (3R)-3-hydroxyacyl-CoA dehydratase 2-like n=1 Tax=Sycon ciliatum TaxID=27933 RepID=UPI0020ADA693|eukprot:scpid96171/ scgid19106/ 3-hydroxyacyl-CoA dehydratase 2; Protein-tyrosine phosphatase-like member B
MAKEISSLSRAYLLLYNGILSNGWLIVLVQMVQHLVKTDGDYAGVYEAVALPLQVFQTAAILEIVHAAIGIVPSSAVVTFAQVFSRIVVLWPVLHYTSGVSATYGPVMMITCWSITEIIRYAFYVSSLLQWTPYALLWCRYTFFYALYPLGVFGELVCVYRAMTVVKNTAQFSFPLPNSLNVSFDFFCFLVLFAALYLPVFPHLYLHMIKQRAKYIGKPKTA